MSDMLNEKFEEFLGEQQVVMEAGAQDPMPRVTATVIPGTGSDPSAVSGDPQQRGSGKDPMPTVPPSVAPNQSTTDLGGSQSEPLHSNKEEGEDNPGAKAAAPVSQDSSVTSTSGKPGKDPQPSVGAEVAYGTGKGPDVSYPIKPSFEELDLSADVSALVEGTELSEEFAEKAKTIFEAAVKAKISEEYDKLVEHFAAELDKQVAEAKSELSEEVNGTVSYAIGQWVEQNQVAIDRGIRNEITEDFIAGLKGLFEEHYISIPDDKVDVVEGMAESIREMEERLDEQVKANVKLQNRLNESAKQVVLNTVSEGLVDTQKDKLAALSEGVDFTTEEEFSKKLTTIRESYFPKEKATVSEVSEEAPVEANEEVSPSMANYLQALNRWSK
tara:strand:- start:4316 stop:5473 length:1158 start_codon:yes stop_codon:yes gene_type:complete